MTYVREPVLQPVPIESLRPTQITVGMRELEEKRERLRKQKPQKIGAYRSPHDTGRAGAEKAPTERSLEGAGVGLGEPASAEIARRIRNKIGPSF